MAPVAPTAGNQTRGTVLALVAFGLWGVLPMFWRELSAVAPLVLLVHRLFWALLFSLALSAVQGKLGQILDALRRPPVRLRLAAASVLMGANWSLYTWAMTHHGLVDAALGYFLNPLALAVLGGTFRGERLTRFHLAALALAGVGVVLAVVGSGQMPWLALGLVATFSVYTLCKHGLDVDPVVSLGFETAVCFPVALVLILVLGDPGSLLPPASGASGTLWTLLALTGPATAVPLMVFAAAARSITLLRLALVEYLSPTLSLLLGLVVDGEPFGPGKAAVFGLVAASCAVFLVAEARATRTALPTGA